MRYEIRVEGVLDQSWSTWFDGMEISATDDDSTLIAGDLPDQAALLGLLARVGDLGLVIACVCRRDGK